MPEIVNLTTTPLHLANGVGVVTTIPPSGLPEPKVEYMPGNKVADEYSIFEGICDEYTGDAPGQVVNMPDPQRGVVFVVRREVGDCLNRHTRPDVFVVGDGPHDCPILDGNGQIVAFTRLKQLRRAF